LESLKTTCPGGFHWLGLVDWTVAVICVAVPIFAVFGAEIVVVVGVATTVVVE
jgi:hypothetical protein